ncbi:MAG: MXAN_2562 family outer membrane beta-barrel protein, partial [Myxococcales bacterium]
ILLLPLAALAQTVGPAGQVTSSFQTVQPSGSISVNIGKAVCQGNKPIDFAVDFTNAGSTPTAGTDTLTFFITKDVSTCTNQDTDPPGNGVNGQTDQTTVRTSFLIQDLIAGLPNGCNDTTTTAAAPFNVFFCSRRKSLSALGGAASVFGSTLQVSFALTPPKPPINVGSTAGDQHLHVNWNSGDTGDRTYDVFVVPWDNPQTTPAPAPDLTKPVVTQVQGTSVDVEQAQGGVPLQNFHTYALYVRSVDGYKNASAASAPPAADQAASPVAVEDFYNHYRTEGGSAGGGGGCASGGSGGLALLGAVAVLLYRRRRVADGRRPKGGAFGGGAGFACDGRRPKAGAFGGAALGLLLLAPSARAEAPGSWTGQNRPNKFLLAAFKIDRYDPGIDSERGINGTPYHDIFHKAPLRYQLEVDWQAAHPFGAILVGGSVGFWQNYGKGIQLDVNGNPTGQADDTTHLNIAPVFAVVTYRFDVLADRYRYLPIIPYLQAGLGAALWSSYNGRGEVSTRTGRGGGRGSGWSRGYTTAVGIALSLDAIDTQLAREAFVDAGIQRTAAFAEYAWTRLDGFKSTGVMNLNDRAWRFGISVEF